MKKSLSILFAIIFAINLNTQAEDFSAVYNGKTIYYNITSSTSPRTVAVTYRGANGNSYSNEYSGAVSIPDSVLYSGNYYKVTSIGDYAFLNCSGLTSITIPNSVTSIVDYAFQNCTGLTSITIPNSVTSIGAGAFYNCSKLTSITIPNSVTSIGDYAFQNCSKLTSITIPNSVTSIGDDAFLYTPYYNNMPDGVVYINNVLYKYKGTMPANTSINIQIGTISISPYAFSGCSGLTSITIPDSVTSIGSSAFSYCSGLTSITIPNSVTSIGYSTFQGCTGLTSITIPNSVTSIGNYSFENCNGLTSITIPNSVISIGDYTFQGCSGLTSITIPNSVTSIGASAFSYCYGLTSISIPNSVTSIGDYAFSGCSGLTSIICQVIYPPTVQGNSFLGVSKTIPLYVPCNSIPSYNSNFYWNEFTNKQAVRTPQFLSASICQGSLYTNYGASIDSAGIYHLVSGCDSVILTLLVNPIYLTNHYDTICQGQSYNNYGFNFIADTSGLYTQNLQTTKGCDSIINLSLIVNPIYNDTIIAEICSNEIYTLNGFNTNTAGFYTQNLQTTKGCDSIVNLSLLVNPIYNDTVIAEICTNETYTLNGFNESNAGFYTQNLQTIKGCDSIVNLSLFVNPIYIDTIFAEICQGETYSQYGFNVNSSGLHTQSLQAINGCDSVVNLSLVVNPTPNKPLSLVIYQMSNYFELIWQGNSSEYDIYRNDSLIANVSQPIYLDNNLLNGTPYCYKVKARIGDCESEFSDLACKSFVGLEDISQSNLQVKLYPNPTEGKSRLEIEGLNSEADVFVYDMIGRVIKKHQISIGENELDIDLSGYAKGIYSIRIVNESINQTKKLIVQ